MQSGNLENELKLTVAAMKALERKQLTRCLDARDVNSRPHAKQQAFFDDIGKIQYRYIKAGNQSGKSACVSRELAWILNGDHPTWKRPKEWLNQPLTILIACQDLTLGAAELWGNKLKPFLKQSEWKEVKSSSTLKQAVNKVTGDTIIFLSHSDGSESNRKHMQGYVAHYVWLDEMPSSWEILEELQLRVQSRQGYLAASFTPKFRNDKIRRAVDASAEPFSKVYQMSKFDNPVLAHTFEAEMNRLSGVPPSVRNTILYGDWSTGESAVYAFEYEESVVDKLPDHYGKYWRHYVSVDPALRSRAGYTLWAENPLDGVWYLIKDDYIEGNQVLDPETLFLEVEKNHEGYNVIGRMSDSMVYFTSLAAKRGVIYSTPYKKTDSRKASLIKGLQTALSSGKIKIGAWCTTFLDEIQSCHYREESDNIVNASSFHTLDCAQYFCDVIPRFNPDDAPMSWEARLRTDNESRKIVERKSQNADTGRKGLPTVTITSQRLPSRVRKSYRSRSRTRR